MINCFHFIQSKVPTNCRIFLESYFTTPKYCAITISLNAILSNLLFITKQHVGGKPIYTLLLAKLQLLF